MSSADKLFSIVQLLLESNAVPHCPLITFIERVREVHSHNCSNDQNSSTTDLLNKLLVSLSSEISEIADSCTAAKKRCEHLKAELSREELALSELEKRKNEAKQLYNVSEKALKLSFSTSLSDFPLKRSAEVNSSSFSTESRPNYHQTGEKNELNTAEKSSHSAFIVQREVDYLNEFTSSNSGVVLSLPVENKYSDRESASPSFSYLHESLLSALQSSSMPEESVLAILQQVKDKLFLNSIECGKKQDLQVGLREFGDLLLVVSQFFSDHPPSVQVSSLHLISSIFYVSGSGVEASCKSWNFSLLAILERLVGDEGGFIETLVRLLNSVNDLVQSEALNFLFSLLGVPFNENASSEAEKKSPLIASSLYCAVLDRFLRSNGLKSLMCIILHSTSEKCLRRALELLGSMLSKVEDTYFTNMFSSSIGSYVCELGGLQCLDLLYTDSLAIVEGVATVISYLTREDDVKEKIREDGGLEKIIFSLCYPSLSVQSKMTVALWNCTCKVENRILLHQVGIIPRLLDFLRISFAKDEQSVLITQNAINALCNLSKENESISDIIAYQGIEELLRLIQFSENLATVENAAETLKNCSKSTQARTIIRSTEHGISILLSTLNDVALQKRFCILNKEQTALLDFLSGTIKNCVFDDESKNVFIAAGGVEVLLRHLQQYSNKSVEFLSSITLENMASILWILTISSVGKEAMFKALEGFDVILQLLQATSPICSFHGMKTQQHFSPFDEDAFTSMLKQNRYAGEHFKKNVELLRSAAPALRLHMGIREKFMGVIRNCSTRKENRAALVSSGAIAVLAGCFWDCFSSWSTFHSAVVTPKNKIISEFCKPSPQLCETVACALWHLSKENKSISFHQGAMEVLLFLISGEKSSPVVLEQAAGAIATLTVGSKENSDAVMRFGGLSSLLRLTQVLEKELSVLCKEYSDESHRKAAMLNILLSIRNTTSSSKCAMFYMVTKATESNFEFAKCLIRILSCSSEDCIKEAAYIVKNFCTSDELRVFFVSKGLCNTLRQILSLPYSRAVLLACESALKSMD